MHIRFFGTYDERRHPRVRVLREGLAASAHLRSDNVAVPIDTAMRVEALQQPLRLLLFVPTLLWAWARLTAQSLRGPRPDVVVVGHLGHLDVLLARVLFPRATLVLDYLISLSDTARDRELGDRGTVSRLLEFGDRLATRVADVVVVDTPESTATVPAGARHKAVVVPVGADRSWFAASDATSHRDGPLSLVFFGLYTPLQGAPVIGEALRLLHERGVAVRATMVGAGQERPATERACGEAPVTWIDWVEAPDLPALVADHDVCLGIFGTGPKAQRVVPNKLYQGAAAGCAIVTSDTAPQRRALPPARFVPPGDSTALAGALQELADEGAARLAEEAGRFANAHHRPESVVDALTATLTSGSIDRQTSEIPVPPNTRDPHDPPLTPRAWLRHDLIWSCLEGLPSEARVLELGTGQGAMAVRLARRFHYTGVEADDTAAGIARARLSAAGLPHRLHHGRFQDVQLAPPYDAVCAFEVLEHIEDDAAALGEWMEHLTPGGRLVLSVPAWQDRFGPWDEHVGHYRRYEPDGLADLLRRVGFVAADVSLYGFPLGNILEVVRNRLASPNEETGIEERTATSGRLLQPSSSAAAVATDLATRPFRLYQRLAPGQRRGTGIVATAQRPT